MKDSDVQVWINNYVGAWRSPNTNKLDEVFSNDITYSVSPWKEPIHGLENLKSFWEQARSGPDEKFTLHSDIVAIEKSTAVIRLEVTYEKDHPKQWRDLWIVKFDKHGLCSSFEEWPFSPQQDDGQM